jgi:hypothetical protein
MPVIIEILFCPYKTNLIIVSSRESISGNEQSKSSNLSPLIGEGEVGVL